MIRIVGVLRLEGEDQGGETGLVGACFLGLSRKKCWGMDGWGVGVIHRLLIDCEQVEGMEGKGGEDVGVVFALSSPPFYY